MANLHGAPAVPADNPDVHHDTSDIDLRAVLAFGLGLIVVAALVYLLVWVLFLFFATREAARAGRRYPLATTQEDRLPPEPRLQTNPRQDLRELRASEDRMLNSYGWVDKDKGIVRVPIGEAMKLVVKRGLPARQEKR
jgi:hypothetical protein